MPTNHGSIEFLKFPDPQHPGDRTHMIKKWLRDSWARRQINALKTSKQDALNQSQLEAANSGITAAIVAALSGTAPVTSNCNDATATGFYSINNTTSNSPTSGSMNMLVIHGDAVIHQIAFYSSTKIYMRRYSSSWNAWQSVSLS